MQRCFSYVSIGNTGPRPPSRPITDGNRSILENVGLITSKLPKNAPITNSACGTFTFSFSTRQLKITAKNGDILFSMDASESTR